MDAMAQQPTSQNPSAPPGGSPQPDRPVSTQSRRVHHAHVEVMPLDEVLRILVEARQRDDHGAAEREL